MSIAILSGTYKNEKCGVGDYASQLFDALNTNSTQHCILISSNKIIENKEVAVIPSINWNFNSFISLHKILKNKDCKKIIFQFPTRVYFKNIQIVFLIPFLRIMGYKIITILHEYGYSAWFAKLRSWPIIFASNRLVVVDDLYKKQLRWLAGKKTRVIYIGSNMPPIILSKEELLNIRKQENSQETLVLCYFGFINESKGFNKLLKILNLAKNQKLNIKLKVIGQLEKNNPYHEKLWKYIEDHNLTEIISISGYLEPYDVSLQIASADYMVLPFQKGLSPRNGSFWAAYQNKIKIITSQSKFSSQRYFSNTYFLPFESSSEVWLNCIQNSKSAIVETPKDIPTWTTIASEIEIILNDL